MSDKYLLGENNEPIPVDDVLEWAAGMETIRKTGRLHVGDDHIDGCRVSTVFLGLDHSFFAGPPLLWETLVFGGPLDMEGKRYHSHEAARRGHVEMVARVVAAQKASAVP